MTTGILITGATQGWYLVRPQELRIEETTGKQNEQLDGEQELEGR